METKVGDNGGATRSIRTPTQGRGVRETSFPIDGVGLLCARCCQPSFEFDETTFSVSLSWAHLRSLSWWLQFRRIGAMADYYLLSVPAFLLPET